MTEDSTPTHSDDGKKTALVPAESTSEKSTKKSSPLLMSVILLQFFLFLCAGGAGFYLYDQLNKSLQDQAATAQALKQDQQQEIHDIHSSLTKLDQQVDEISITGISALENQVSEIYERIESYEQTVGAINQRLQELSPRDEQKWLISQIEYFIDMAQYRLTLTNDYRGAALLLDQASAITAQLRSPDAQALLKALSHDRAKLKIDGHWEPEVIYAQLNALAEQIPSLTKIAYSKKSLSDIGDHDTLSSEYWQRILAKLIRIQKTSNEVKPFLDDTTRTRVEQHLYMLITEGQLNIVRHNQKGYESALAQLRTIVKTAFDPHQKQTLFFLEELARLEKIEISTPQYTLNTSQQALRNLIRIFEQQSS